MSSVTMMLKSPSDPANKTLQKPGWPLSMLMILASYRTCGNSIHFDSYKVEVIRRGYYKLDGDLFPAFNVFANENIPERAVAELSDH